MDFPFRPILLATVAVFVAVVAVALLVQQRSSPLGDLTDVERAYVIPSAADLGPVGSCGHDNVGCAGPDPSSLLTLTWFEVGLPASLEGVNADTENLRLIGVDVAQTLRGEPDDRVEASIRLETIDALEEAAKRGYRLIGRTDSDENRVSFIAIDDDGRFAALGPDATLLITLPFARAAAAANAESGEAYLLTFLGR